MRDLAGKVVLVTGATGGIGPHIALSLAEHKCKLFLSSRSAAELAELAGQVRATGVEVDVHQADVTDRAALEGLVAAARERFGGIDVLVNNAGVEITGAYDRMDHAEIDVMIQVNVAAPMHLTRIVLPLMLERGRGHLVFMSSYVAKSGCAYLEGYSATKGALVPFSQALRASYSGAGVSASVVLPGVVEAGMYLRWRDESGLPAPRLLGRAKPEAVARAVVAGIRRDVPEIYVTGMPTRIVTTLAEASPRLGERMREMTGLNGWMRKIGVMRDRAELDATAAPQAGRGPLVGGSR